MAKCSFLRANEVRALAQDNMLLWTEICGIQKAILEASSPCNVMGGQLEVIVNDGTPMTWVSGIQSIDVTNGGTDYEPVVATATIIHPLGSGATLEPLVTGGVITGFSVTTAGTNYDPVETTLTVTTVGGSGAILDPMIVDGVVVSINILNPGTGYLPGDAVVIVDPASVGSGFLASVATIDGSGGISSITISSNGIGYIKTIFATVEITHPTGEEFVGIVQTSGGSVTGVSIQNGGFGYQPLVPTAYIVDNDATGTGAVLEITETDIVGGAIQNINVVQGGFGYSQNVDVVITPAPTSSGANATATATVTPDPNNYGPISPLYYEVLSGQSSDRMKTMQIEFITNYFTTLGYNIRPQVNPQTENTLQWWILW